MRNQRGFTLIELLVVIAIIGILATLVITQLGSARVKARNSAAKSDITEMGKAIETYKTNNNDDIVNACTAKGVAGTQGTGVTTTGAGGDQLNGNTGGNFKLFFDGGSGNGNGTTPGYPVKIVQTTGASNQYFYVYRVEGAVNNNNCTVATVDGNAHPYLVGTNLKSETNGTTDTAFYINNGTTISNDTVVQVP